MIINNISIIIKSIIFSIRSISLSFRYYLVTCLFSKIAPVSSDISMKPISDKLYLLKQNIERDLQLKIQDDIVSHVPTYQYNDIRDTLDSTEFAKLTNNHTKPILIKGVYDNEFLKQYNFTNLKNKHGDIMVEAIKSPEMSTSIKVAFGKYLDMINSGEKYYMTVNNSIAIAMDKTRFMQFYMNILEGTTGFSNMFIGNSESSTHLHCEIAGSCATQISGIKKWYLIDPKYSEYLNDVPDKNNMFHMSIRGFIKNRDEIIENIPRYEVISETGDFLFVPPWWWHETLNLSDENIMLSYRPSLFLAPYKTNLLYTFMGIKNSLGFNSIMYPLLVKAGIIDQNKDTVVESITEISYRIPESIKKLLVQEVIKNSDHH